MPGLPDKPQHLSLTPDGFRWKVKTQEVVWPLLVGAMVGSLLGLAVEVDLWILVLPNLGLVAGMYVSDRLRRRTLCLRGQRLELRYGHEVLANVHASEAIWGDGRVRLDGQDFVLGFQPEEVAWVRAQLAGFSAETSGTREEVPEPLRDLRSAQEKGAVR